ncbi:hypothetical protein GCM10007989_24950 [Devosia pacifica]|uniref:Aminoglycoside phosphotransferase domain-containing protein n=1 Tax=Devosia pacifica TaxID=1335967 RepID=A0A918S975_9HYPH|nr:hypothetical protein GCM10007989_24950 [Devosia pacifica]
MDALTANRAIAPLELGKISAVIPLAGGSADVFRLDLDTDIALVLKVYQDDETKIVGSDSYATARAHAIGLPVTRYLLVDYSRTRLPFRYVITNFLPGQAAGSLRNHRDIASLYKQMGNLLRSVHTIGMPAYGRFDADGIADPVSTNAVFVRNRLDSALSRFMDYGADPELASRLRDIAESDFDAVVPHSRGAVLAHDDLHPNNVLVTETDGLLHLSGLIDFGNAHAADAISDLAKCLFCSEHDAPGSAPYILEGYGPMDHPTPSRALALYTLLHRLTMWSWLRRVGVLPTPDAPIDIMDDLKRTARAG